MSTKFPVKVAPPSTSVSDAQTNLEYAANNVRTAIGQLQGLAPIDTIERLDALLKTLNVEATCCRFARVVVEAEAKHAKDGDA